MGEVILFDFIVVIAVMGGWLARGLAARPAPPPPRTEPKQTTITANAMIVIDDIQADIHDIAMDWAESLVGVGGEIDRKHMLVGAQHALRQKLIEVDELVDPVGPTGETGHEAVRTGEASPTKT